MCLTDVCNQHVSKASLLAGFQQELQIHFQYCVARRNFVKERTVLETVAFFDSGAK
jgi:hypothetical protein